MVGRPVRSPAAVIPKIRLFIRAEEAREETQGRNSDETERFVQPGRLCAGSRDFVL